MTKMEERVPKMFVGLPKISEELPKMEKMLANTKLEIFHLSGGNKDC